MFNSIAKWKIWGIVAGIGLIMFQRIKYLKAKNERLEHNEEVSLSDSDFSGPGRQFRGS